MITVHENVLTDPHGYRAQALEAPFQSVTFGTDTFHGVASVPTNAVVQWFTATYPRYVPTLTFLRRSPEGQVEPNFIHTDVDMGDLTAILYLNPDPPVGDGTSFWRPRERDAWDRVDHVDARFNRCVVFSAPLFHSRSLVDNYGTGETARLIQVLFAQEVQEWR